MIHYHCVTIPSFGLMFYGMALHSNPQRAPLVVWLNGGPGYSSMYGLFCQHGPQVFDAAGTLVKNPHAWNSFANVVYIDNPVGTGFSSATKYCKTRKEVAANLQQTLDNVYVHYPYLEEAPLFVCAESFGANDALAFACTLPSGRLRGVGLLEGYIVPEVVRSRLQDLSAQPRAVLRETPQHRNRLQYLTHMCNLPAFQTQLPRSARKPFSVLNPMTYIKYTDMYESSIENINRLHGIPICVMHSTSNHLYPLNAVHAWIAESTHPHIFLQVIDSDNVFDRPGVVHECARAFLLAHAHAPPAAAPNWWFVCFFFVSLYAFRVFYATSYAGPTVPKNLSVL